MSDMVVNGKARLDEDSSYGKVIVNGKVKCDGSCSVENILVNGKTKIHGTLRSCGTVQLHGKSEIETIECRELIARGGLHAGRIVADTAKIEISTNCSADTIQCGELMTSPVVGTPEAERLKDAILGVLKAGLDYDESDPGAVLHAGTITCQKASLCNTEADEVTAAAVEIGPGCRIKKVTYSDTFHCDTTSTVESVVKE